MIADVLAPVVPVRKQSDLYYVHGREGWFPEDEFRAPGTPAPEIPGLTVSTQTYFAKEYALKIAVTPEERENADSPLDPDRDGTELITDKINMRRELRVMTKVTTAANFPAAHTVTLSGTAQWSDYGAVSDPVGDIKTGIRLIHSVLFMEPNLAVMPYQVMTQLEDHPDFIERIKYSQAGVITADIIAAVVGLPRIVVPGLGYNSAGNPAATATYTYLWGKDVLLLWNPPRAGLKQPAFMYEFVWRFAGARNQVVDRWFDNDRIADLIRVRRRYDHQFINIDGTGDTLAGYLIKAAVA